MSRKGFTLVELAVSLALFSILMVVAGTLFVKAVGVWRGSERGDTAKRELTRARVALTRELALTDPATLARARVPPSLGAGDDGEALWFLSPIDPVSGDMVHLSADAQPFWQRNVLFYLTVPLNHDALFHQSCAGAAGPTGYETACPHKVLIRKVIDSGVPTDPADESTLETLIGDISPYLTRPVGYDATGLTEAGVEEVQIVANQLLSFESFPGAVPTELRLDLRAVAIGEAARTLAVGSVSLRDTDLTEIHQVSVFLKN